MRRFLILLSPQGYEMSVGIPDSSINIPSNDTIEKYVKIKNIFENESTYISSRDVESYKAEYISRISKEQNGFDYGSLVAYQMRKNMAHTQGQVEFIFALEQEDMDWIYQRNPVDAGIIFCELFMNTKPDEMVHKKIENRTIIGFNKCADDYWEKIKYDMEDFYELYKTQKSAMLRRENRR